MAFSDILAKYKTLPQWQLDALDTVGRELVERNRVMNLTAITDERGVALMHFYDSIIPLSTGYFTPGARVLDIGCGGGFPSLPLCGKPPPRRAAAIWIYFPAGQRSFRF